MEDLLKVGVITTTHGIRGEVKVYPTTDADRFLDLEYVLLDTGREKRKLEIENVRYFKNLVILKFMMIYLELIMMIIEEEDLQIIKNLMKQQLF